MNQPPRRVPRSLHRDPRDQIQEVIPHNVIHALIGQSKRRCAAYAEMLDKQAAGLAQLNLECQQMAGEIRHVPLALKQLGEGFQAVTDAAKMNESHLHRQVQVEQILQDELRRWLRGEELLISSLYGEPLLDDSPESLTRQAPGSPTRQAPGSPTRQAPGSPPPAMRPLPPQYAGSPVMRGRVPQQPTPQALRDFQPPPQAYAAYFHPQEPLQEAAEYIEDAEHAEHAEHAAHEAPGVRRRTFATPIEASSKISSTNGSGDVSTTSIASQDDIETENDAAS